MQTERFSVRNVKCQGCVKTICDGLVDQPGVQTVEVQIEDGQVTVRGEDLSRDVLATKLGELGYPVVAS